MSDSVNQPRTLEVLTAAPVRARRKPRDWPDEEKERLIAETLLPEADVSAMRVLRDWIPRSFTGGVARHCHRGWLHTCREP
ncbi:hypothetical protein QA648_36050 (plasmid) [Rhizobium sp. CB3171]|uniref:hypothetical protein n=1 Tax=Rhizobium sp. CB3171 TaxID=3039157 RepID=UPI0024B1A5EC|nr:hypothetical protein [Rhizobium sp. CB3171]WFU07306.1 hypothetical protein QA648_36050 [Rhizobium sp. CB3171]